MKLFTAKNFSLIISIIFHAILFLILFIYFNQKVNQTKEQVVEIGFGGTIESNSPGSPGGGNEEEVTPAPKKEIEKAVKKEKKKTQEETISENSKKSNKKPENTASGDSTKGKSNGSAASGGTGPGSGTGSGSGNGQPGSGPPKKGLYIPNDVYFVAVDQMPVPVGGMESINARAFYPPQAKSIGIQGTVYVLAFIDERGYVKKVSLIKGIGYGCDQSAIQAVKNTRFEPGILHGVPVKVQLTVPVNFSSNN